MEGRIDLLIDLAITGIINAVHNAVLHVCIKIIHFYSPYSLGEFRVFPDYQVNKFANTESILQSAKIKLLTHLFVAYYTIFHFRHYRCFDTLHTGNVIALL